MAVALVARYATPPMPPVPLSSPTPRFSVIHLSLHHLPSSVLPRFFPPFPLKPLISPFSSRGPTPHLCLRSSKITFSSLPSPEIPSLDEAREALVQVLQESGASRDHSIEISSKSPKYLESLVTAVLELDEHSLWGSWSDGNRGNDGEEELDQLSFKKKVYLMAKKKGDCGVAAFLESVGLKHSSAMLVARCLASERLPELIDKVKFVKEIIYSSNGLGVLVGINARRMMMHLSISVDDDVQRTLSFFEKIEARHGGLNMLGCQDASFPYLIESFPNLLLRSREIHLKPLIELLRQVGVPEANIGVVLLLFPPIIFYDVKKDIKPRIFALKKAGVEDKNIGKVLLKYPWILSTCIQENYEKILAFFSTEKVPKSSIDVAIKSWPHLLGCSTQKMKSIVEQFGELGVNKKMLVPVITSSPQLFLRKPNELPEVVALMEEVGLDGKTTGRILCRCPEIFGANVNNTLKKKLKFLTDFGISRDRLSRIIRKYPEFLGLDIHNTLLPRMRYLMGIGLSRRDVCSMICRFSPLLGYSIDVVLKPKFEFLSTTMQKPLKEIVEYPRYFSYSLEKKIKPRFWVLKSRNIECSLKEMLGKNDEEFAAEYLGIGRMLVVPAQFPRDDS